jgi:hypothetical protein
MKTIDIFGLVITVFLACYITYCTISIRVKEESSIIQHKMDSLHRVKDSTWYYKGLLEKQEKLNIMLNRELLKEIRK